MRRHAPQGDSLRIKLRALFTRPRASCSAARDRSRLGSLNVVMFMSHVVVPPQQAGEVAPPPGDRVAIDREPILGRVVLLLCLLVVSDLWLVHHAGWGIRNFSIVALLAGTVGGVAKLLDRPFEKELEMARTRFANALRFVAHPALLAAVTIAVVVGLATSSSVVVVAEGEAGDPGVEIVPLDDPEARMKPRLTEGTRLVREAFVSTTPFGRSFRVEAAGYVPRTFQLYPVTGLRLQLGTDLQPSPSVLIRPGVDALSALADGAILKVWHLMEADSQVIAADTGHAVAFMLGRRRMVPSENRLEWQRELTEENAPESTAAGMLGIWQDPVSLVPRRTMAPDDRLRIEVVFHHGGRAACAEITLGTEPLVDVPLNSC